MIYNDTGTELEFEIKQVHCRNLPLLVVHGLWIRSDGSVLGQLQPVVRAIGPGPVLRDCFVCVWFRRGDKAETNKKRKLGSYERTWLRAQDMQ